MSVQLLPLRFRIVHYAAGKSAFTVRDLLHDLQQEYGGEKQFSPKMLSHHCESLRASGILTATDVDIDSDGTPLITYHITEYGSSRLSYLPRKWWATASERS